MLGLGTKTGKENQCKETMTSLYNTIPTLAGLRKDHKPCDDQEKGPPLRQVCQARVAPNGALGNLLSQVVKGLALDLGKRQGTDSLSSEEVCAAIRVTNNSLRDRRHNARPKVRTRRQRIKEGRYVLASMDVSALYPSIQWDTTCKEVKLACQDSEIDLQDFNWHEEQQVCGSSLQ